GGQEFLVRVHFVVVLFAALSLTLSHGREDGAAVVIKGFARKTRKTSCTGCFLFFKRPEINACKSKSLFKLPATAKSAATYP
ncbi:hypothetical protein Q6325_29300, partial [Klebsiella pneumoniae]|uniref:hypothetical protein n=1 Tax=Klebsiella pneumoniae TaxID=573 RepID=UPI00273209B8